MRLCPGKSCDSAYDALALIEDMATPSAIASSPRAEYEPQIVHLESAIRTHIRTEQQLKLHIEQMIEAREEKELEIAKLRQQVQRME